ncbi:nicotinate phosphoribosyltransferase [Paraburkholderia sp. CNPSo 3157]|uniref:Nicotinate phosphoribosyltransferase n=1 Tax=Paraburkholderia franconis TaxID=2654983 RepID=A0A7X1NJB2_9BURK|nr:nicotinate phosphoribosyltransferase [Paraburkholderia franconis]MPW23015.1 nicotinate phosphoribosyltransferase [Paraburkholderia franconis]
MSQSCDNILLTDLYELTMLQAYFDSGMNDVATFEFFVRSLPARRNFLMAAGLELVLDYLCRLGFRDSQLAELERTGHFSPRFIQSLESLRFTGSVDAMPEGTVFFSEEPILRITAPLREAQIIESRLINLIHYSTLVASKAARMVLAAPDKRLVDFGLRRAHGSEAAMLSARASYLAGFSGTATLLAGIRYGIPVFGTMAHSYVQAHEHEIEAFEHFVRSQPDNAVLLIDTYDTEAAAVQVVNLAQRLAREGLYIKGVRLDSGNLGAHARHVRRTLDASGLRQISILASGNLDEFRLRELAHSDAPIDGFGIGTRMNTSADAPYLDCAYKLTEYMGKPRRKRSEGKATWPGRKQVFRRLDADGRIESDCIALEDERQPGAALIAPVMHDGVRIGAAGSLDASRDRARRELDSLPPDLAELEPATAFRPNVSAALVELARQLDAGIARERRLPSR